MITVFIHAIIVLSRNRNTCVNNRHQHVSEFPINTILAWIINDYHEQGNIIIITNLLLPLGHISNSLTLALESII